MYVALIFTIVALIFIGVGVLFFLLSQKVRAKKVGTLEFKAKKFITGNELHFYQLLVKAVPDHLVVFPQVSMGALIDTALNPKHPLYWQARELFSGKICDFVLCDKTSLNPVLVVELDDVTHDFSRDEGRDKFLAQAGLRTARFWSRNKPTLEELKEAIAAKIAC